MTRSGFAHRLRSQRGQVAVEMLGTTGLLVLAALVAWQLALAGWTAIGAANAARTAARAYSRTGDSSSAVADGKQSLSDDGLGAGSSVVVGPGTAGPGAVEANVRVKIPIIIPGFASPITIPASANMPNTG